MSNSGVTALSQARGTPHSDRITCTNTTVKKVASDTLSGNTGVFYCKRSLLLNEIWGLAGDLNYSYYTCSRLSWKIQGWPYGICYPVGQADNIYLWWDMRYSASRSNSSQVDSLSLIPNYLNPNQCFSFIFFHNPDPPLPSLPSFSADDLKIN